MSTQLSRNGSRYMTRGWKNSWFVKRMTSKHRRRQGKHDVRYHDGEQMKHVYKGWSWW